MAYFNVHHERQDEFTVSFLPDGATTGRELPVRKSARVRVGLSQGAATVAVLDGELPVKITPTASALAGGAASRAHEVEVKKGEELTFADAGGEPILAKLTPEPFDQWNQERSDYERRYSADSSYSSYPYYGRGDLNYYGAWYVVPGGLLWQPYGAGYGWSPFANGAWAWYPGAGYTWVSAYPWGWLPYRYGSWMFVPGWGWGWMPGASWNSWVTVPVVLHAPVGYVAPAVPAIQGPRHPTVPVTLAPLSPLQGAGAGSGSARTEAPVRVMERSQPPVVRVPMGSRPAMTNPGPAHAAGTSRAAASAHGAAAGHATH
jgi:hypothetical protein